jgi:hypothetical protein
MAKSHIYMNGTEAGSWEYGYTSFRVDVTDLVREGDNVLTVVADTRRWDSRWYPGAGIYRKVVLVRENPIHIAHWGQRVSNDGDELAGIEPSTVRVATTIENHTASAVRASVETILRAPSGGEVSRIESVIDVPANGKEDAANWLPVENPVRWDVNNPALYRVETVVRVGGTVVDEAVQTWGIRTFAFTADDGFHLNGRRVQLQGVNLHADLGPLGMAFNTRAAERQLEIMKQMGVNALRTSHNPPAPEVLELCDRMGILVWDECFDKWDGTAGRFDDQPALREHGRTQIRSMVMRDRNHPCVIAWSIGNEISPGGREGITAERIAFMSSYVREFDLTRPVALACQIPSVSLSPTFDALDIAGWNYARRYALFRERYPEKPILYSESASAVSTRGYYEPDLPDSRLARNMETLQVSAYELNSADWSDVADAELSLMQTDRFVAGEFVWTGFDYLGEPTPFDAQARSSYFGIVDLCGFPKDRFYLYRSQWRPEVPTVHILPHWNWQGREGGNVPVFVFTNGESAELFLNGRSLGIRRKGEVPAKPEDWAASATLSATSSAEGHSPALAADGDAASFWKADPADSSPCLTFDLGQKRDIGTISLVFEREEKHHGYVVEASDNGTDWTLLLDKPTSEYPLWCGLPDILHRVDTSARYLRVRFLTTNEGVVPAVRSAKVLPGRADNDYYDVTYQYRLRWNEVAYEPGELRAVAYDAQGRQIGESIVRTTGPAVALRLTADRSEIPAAYEALSFVTVEAVDARGDVVPLACDMVDFTIEGAGAIAGLDNGNPMCFEPMQGNRHSLYNGKALVVVRAQDGAPSTIRLGASAKGLAGAETTIQSR